VSDDAQVTAETTAENEPGVMPLMEHLREFRTRLIRAIIPLIVLTIASFFVTGYVFEFLLRPLGDVTVQALKPTESLGNYMKVALLCGLIASMPFLVYQIGSFIAPGLTKKEKRYLFILVPGATLCFLMGVAFAYFVMMPASLKFLGNFMSEIIEQNWAIGEYLSFATSLMFWIGVAFELPLFVYFLAKAGVIDAETLRKSRKYALVAIAVLAAVITPTVDPLNMMLVMGPLVVLYEVGVILARIA